MHDIKYFDKAAKRTNLMESSFKQLLTEAISASDFVKAGVLIGKYLTKKTGMKFIRFPEPVTYKNNIDGLITGIRYTFKGGKRAIRFNWGGKGNLGSNELLSVDLWTKQQQLPTHHLGFDRSVSLVKTLPEIVEFIMNPEFGSFAIVPEQMTESVLLEDTTLLTEGRKVLYTADELWTIAYDYLIPDTVPSAAARDKSQKAADLITAMKKEYPQFWNKKTYIGGAEGGKDAKYIINQHKGKILEAAGIITATVTKGATTESNLTPVSPSLLASVGGEDIEDAPAMEKKAYEEVQKDMLKLAGYVLSGVRNSLIVFGRGGVGKSFGLKKYLKSRGLGDGTDLKDNAAIWVSGSMSASGFYKLLSRNPNALVFVDDCDSIFDTQEGRNLIKKATESEKVRTMTWAKGTGVKPQSEIDKLEDEGKDVSLLIPDKFDFTGKMIFVSNLDGQKIDPDGAIRTRAYMLEVYPTDEEVYNFMKKIVEFVDLGELDDPNVVEVSQDERLEVIDEIWRLYNARVIKILQLRLVDAAIKQRAVDPDNWKDCLYYI